jgi:dCTP deaminase
MASIVGVRNDTLLQALVASGAISSSVPLVEGQIQPASLDLRLGSRAYRIQASVLPGPTETVEDATKPLVMYEFSLDSPRLLERGGIYLIPVMERLALPADIQATASPKSSTGRLDIFVRLVTDGGETYDTVPAGYTGPLWLEVMPLTFPIVVRAGDRLNQLRLRHGTPTLGDEELRALHARTPLLHSDPMTPARVEEGLWISIDLEGLQGGQVVGYRAKRHTQPVDLSLVGGYDWRDYWEPITPRAHAPMVLYPEEFYIFASRERVAVPAGYSAELVAYDTRVGELRLHYAGFFDPGFGIADGKPTGTHAVLEVRAHDVPCVLRHGQRLGRFIYERLAEPSQALYGHGIGSNYAGQGLKLAKQFRME